MVQHRVRERTAIVNLVDGRDLQLEHEQRDGDREHAVTEGLDSRRFPLFG
jgi:hypothetical protein